MARATSAPMTGFRDHTGVPLGDDLGDPDAELLVDHHDLAARDAAAR